MSFPTKPPNVLRDIEAEAIDLVDSDANGAFNQGSGGI